jgi:hypothetical protein
MLWSGLCNLYGVVNLCRQIFDHTTTPVLPFVSGVVNSLPSLEHRRDYVSVVHHVCQSVEYILEDETLLAGPLSITPALGIVLDSLRGQRHCASEAAWLRAAIGTARQRGLGLLKYAR